MKKLLLLAALGGVTALTTSSCSPLSSNAIRHDGGSPAPVFTPPDSWGSGGNFTGFAASRPSSNGYDRGAGGAPC